MNILAKSALKSVAPNLYFAFAALYFAADSGMSLLALLLVLPFLKQIIYPCKLTSLFLAVLMLAYSVIMFVSAGLTVYEEKQIPSDSGFYLAFFFIISNFLMTGLLFADSKVNESEKIDNLSSSSSDFL